MDERTFRTDEPVCPVEGKGSQTPESAGMILKTNVSLECENDRQHTQKQAVTITKCN
jgi:hypothetical protein